MAEERTLAQARYIFTTGKMIRDRIERIVNDYVTQLGEPDAFFSMSYSQFHTVMMVRRHGELSMTELASLLGVSPPSASAMVDKLVERGCLCREHSTQDRRKVVVTISEEAKKTVDALTDQVVQLFVDLVEKIGPETADKWCEVLQQIETVFNNEG